MGEVREWLLLIYRIPSEPSKNRVSVWREVKKLGAAYLQDGVCLLVDRPPTRAAFTDLGERIVALGGEARVFTATPLAPELEAELIADFHRLRDQEYAEVIEQCGHFRKEVEKETRAGKFTFGEMEELEEDLDKLVRWMEKVKGRDHFGAPGQARAAASLDACRQACDTFSRRVYAQEHGDDQELPGRATVIKSTKKQKER